MRKKKRQKNRKVAPVGRQRVSGGFAIWRSEKSEAGLLSYSSRIRIVLGTELENPGTKLTLSKLGCWWFYLQEGCLILCAWKRKWKWLLKRWKIIRALFCNTHIVSRVNECCRIFCRSKCGRSQEKKKCKMHLHLANFVVLQSLTCR